MTLIREAEVPRHFRVHRFKHSPIAGIVVSIVAIGGGAFVGSIAWREKQPLLWLFVAGALLVAWFALFQARAALRASNWLMLLASDGVYLKIRSYLNAHLPKDDAVVCFIARGEIVSVRRIVQEENQPGRGTESAAVRRVTHLELALNHEGTGELAEALAAERERKSERGGLKVHDYPVRLVGSRAVRVDWSGIRPKAGAALKLLGRDYEIGPEENLAPVEWKALEGRALEDYLLELAERGRNMEATKIARIRYGWPLAEAKKFVDELTGGRRPPR